MFLGSWAKLSSTHLAKDGLLDIKTVSGILVERVCFLDIGENKVSLI